MQRLLKKFSSFIGGVSDYAPYVILSNGDYSIYYIINQNTGEVLEEVGSEQEAKEVAIALYNATET
jgi:hypothetical protein